MTETSPETLLADVLKASAWIAQFMASVDRALYVADTRTQSAVERQFIIVGEAMLRLRRVAPNVAARIPDIHRVVAFRHVLVHEYDGIDSDYVFEVTQIGLPSLIAQAQFQLERLKDV